MDYKVAAPALVYLRVSRIVMTNEIFMTNEIVNERYAFTSSENTP